MPRPRNQPQQANVEDLVGQATEVAVNAFVDRAYDVFERFRQGQLAPKSLPKEYLSQTFTCVGCRSPFPVSELEMVHPANGFATCKRCYAFMWEAAEQKLKFLAKQAARAGASAGRAPAGEPSGTGAPRMKPWEILGVSQDATEEEIKKAYRKKALECHPDTVPESAPVEDKLAAKERFHVLTKAKDAMLSVRRAAEQKP
mgnify:CR=1 FL=1